MLMNIKRAIKCGWVVIEGRVRKIFHWKIEVESWPSSKWRICEIMSSSQPNANVAWICTIYKHRHIHFFCSENSEGPRGPWKASAASSLQRRVWNTVMKLVDAEAKLPESQPCFSDLHRGDVACYLMFLSYSSPYVWQKCGSVIKKSICVHVYE